MSTVVKMQEVKGAWEQIVQGRGVDRFTKRKCQAIIDEATRIFESQAKHTRPPTHPQYVDSFSIEKVGRYFRVVNSDPAANLVEFGAHPGGGETFTLRYRPLGRAIEVLSLG